MEKVLHLWNKVVGLFLSEFRVTGEVEFVNPMNATVRASGRGI